MEKRTTDNRAIQITAALVLVVMSFFIFTSSVSAQYSACNYSQDSYATSDPSCNTQTVSGSSTGSSGGGIGGTLGITGDNWHYLAFAASGLFVSGVAAWFTIKSLRKRT